MRRLTKEFEFGLGHTECYEACGMCLTVECGSFCTGLQEMLKKLAHYEDLEEQLEKIYGGKMPLGKVVENLNRIVQNGEDRLDYARIITNEYAEKWDRWLDLEEQGRLIELPCKVGDEVWVVVHNELYFWNEDPEYFIAKTKFCLSSLKQIGKKIFLTKEEAEAKLAELKGE